MNTASTPSIASAAEASIRRMRAEACGLFSTAMWVSAVVVRSSVNGSRPETIRSAAGARTARPMPPATPRASVEPCPASASRMLR